MTAFTAVSTITLGRGTSYPWATMPEGFGTPGVRSQDVDRVDRDGVFAGSDLLTSRTVVFDVWVLGSSEEDAEDKLNTLKGFFVRSGTNVEVVVNLTGTRGYVLVGRPRGCDVVLDTKLRGGVIRARCVFVAVDPRLYLDGDESVIVDVQTGDTGGLQFNATPNFTFSGAITIGETTIINAGTYPTPVTFVLAGPITDPRIIHVGLGVELALTGTVASGETLVLSSDDRTVLLNGTSSRYSWLSTTSQWFDLVPGSNTLQLRGTAGTGSATVQFRSAYV